MATLVNGNGNVAVYAQQDADLLTGALGASTRIMNVGSKMAYTIEDANTIAVADGVILTKEGRRIQVDVGNVDEFTIPTGSAGVTRYYIIGYHLYTDGSANQKCETFVQLMSNGSETITENTFRNGASEVYVSLYRVKQIGLNLDTITALLSVGIALTDMTDVIGDTDISGIGDGTLTGGLNAVNQNLTEKVSQYSDTTYSVVKGLGVDTENNELGLIIEGEGGADTLFPFKKGGDLIELIPTMTGNTTPRGVAFASSTYTSFQPYMAFNKDYANNASWMPTYNQSGDNYIGYDFGYAVKAVYAKITLCLISNTNAPLNLVIQGSTDGNTYEDDSPSFSTPSNTTNTCCFSIIVKLIGKEYQYYRLLSARAMSPSVNHEIRINDFQLYEMV